VTDNPRIDDLRRRVQQDPASIAFAHLADEHRRAGDFQEAVRVCRAGLEHHPTYILAHVTLGRALMDLDQYAEARTEFEYVLRAAPDNLIALKGMEELQQKEGPASPQVAAVARTPLKLRPDTETASPGKDAPLVASPPQAQVAPPPQAQVAPPPQAQVAPPPQAQVTPPPRLPVAPLPQAEVAPPPQAPVAPPPFASPPTEAQVAAPPPLVDPALDELHGWLAALDADRGDREDARPGGSAPAAGKRNPPY